MLASRPRRASLLNSPRRWLDLDRDCSLVEKAGHLGWSVAVRSYLRLRHNLQVSGADHLPVRPPFILTANHSSHLDALVLASALPLSLRDQVFPLAAGDVFFERWLTAALAVGLVNALPMWRKRMPAHGLVQLRRRLIDGRCGYILFPEGKRSRDGRMLPFKAGIGRLVAGSAVPVIPCHLEGTFAACPAGRVWPRGEPIRLRVGAPLRFEGLSDDRRGWSAAARQVEQGVRELANQAAIG